MVSETFPPEFPFENAALDYEYKLKVGNVQLFLL